MPTPKSDVRFLFTLQDTDPYRPCLVATANAVYLEDGKVLNPMFGRFTRGPGDLDSFVVRAQATDGFGPGFYGWAAEYSQPYSVRVDQAQAMFRLLTRLDRKMTASTERFGFPHDLAAFMARVAEGLGAPETHCFGRRVTGDSDICGTGYRWMDTDGLRCHLADELAKWQIRHDFPLAA